MRAVTRWFTDEVDLNDIAGGDGYLFVRDGVGLAGRGVAARVEADEALSFLNSIECDDHVGRPGTGPQYVARAVRESPWPVWVTGGVDPDTVGDLVAAGARHFVVVRWLVDADDPEGAARRLRRRIDDLLDDRAG